MKNSRRVSTPCLAAILTIWTKRKVWKDERAFLTKSTERRYRFLDFDDCEALTGTFRVKTRDMKLLIDANDAIDYVERRTT